MPTSFALATLKFALIACCLISCCSCFNFADLFGEGESSSNESVNEPNGKSNQSPKERICPFFQCPDGTCAEKPIDCRCPEGMRKCYVGDWYFCIGGNDSFPAGSSKEPKQD